MPRKLSALAACLLLSAGSLVQTSAQCAAPSFAAARSYGVGSSFSSGDPAAAAVADFNGDGLSDVVTANDSTHSVSVLLGAAGGGFTAATNFGGGGLRPVALAVGDFNEDGRADVVTANYNSSNVSVRLGDGAGALGAPSQFTAGPNPAAVVAADFDRDGHADLAVAVRGANHVRVLKGTGAGTFTPAQSVPTGDGPQALATADFNIDGRPDLAVANYDSDTVYVLAGDGVGGFALSAFLPAGNSPKHIAAADLNGDGRIDVAVANYASANVSVHANRGDGSFAAAVNYSTGSVADSVAVGDFNNDGRADIVAGYTAGGVSVRLGTGAGAFGAARRFDVASGPTFVAVDDFNGDGSEDIAAASYGANSVSLLAGDGAGNFLTAPRMGSGVNVISTVAADFNNDSNPDLASANENQDTVSVRLGDGAGGFGAAADFATATRPYSLALGDFNNDGAADLVTANFLGGSLSVLLGNGAGGFAPAINVGGGNLTSYPWFVAVGEFNGDGKQDLAFSRNTQFNQISVMLGDGAGNFGPPADFAANSHPRAIAVGDFNADNKADLAVAENSNVAILLGNGAGAFAPPSFVSTEIHAGSEFVIARDLNGDGKLDLATSNFNHNSVSVILGNGNGTFAAPVHYPTRLRPEFVTSADFNGDGLVDLAAVNDYSQTISVLLNAGAGVFGAATHWAAYPHPTAASVADFNKDGRADIAAGGSGGLTLLLNTCGDAPPAPSVSLSVGDATVVEGDSGSANAVFQVSLSAPSAQVVTVDYRASGHTAAAGADFQPVAGTLTFAPGETSKTVEVGVVGDLADEFTEVFHVSLYRPAGARIVDRRGVGSITDADAEPVISVNDVSAPEGDFDSTPFVFTVSLSAPSGKTVRVNANNADGTAGGSDYFYYAGPYTLIFAPGETTKSVALSSQPDFNVEADENFFVNLSAPDNAAIADAQGVGTIQNDDFTPTVSLSVNDVSVVEGNSGLTDALFTVSLSGPTTKTVKVNYSAPGGGSDHQATSGTLTFAPGETSKTFVVKVIGDAVIEPDEQIEVRLNEARNALMGDSAGLLTIVNDDGGVSISISDVTVTEGDSGTKDVTFVVSLSAPVQHQVTYEFRTAPGTAADGEDYLAVSGTDLFGPGVTTRSHTVPVRGDTIAEADETFFMRLSNVGGATIADGEGRATIIDNDGAGTGTPSFQFDAHTYSVAEGGGEATVTVTRTGDLSAPASVGYNTEMTDHFLSASDRSDYTPALGVLHFAAGESSKSFKVIVTDDAYFERHTGFGDEAIDVRLSSPTGGAALGTPSSARIVILDNDAASGPSPVSNDRFDPAFFVRQHYADFLNRQPDAPGLAFWTNQITECETRPAAERQGCREVRRINVSAAFFLSIEFQQTGFLVHRAFGSALGTTRVGGVVPLTLREFLSDTQEIGRGVVVNSPGWEQALEQNKARYFDEFVRRAQFTSRYPASMSAAAFVDALNANTLGSLSQAERDALVSGLMAGTMTRAQVLRAVAEDADYAARERNRAFVLMQYFGYLRRNPNDAPELNLNFAGYNFWLGKLNQFGGDYVNAEMIKGFITSGEYQQRFGQ